MGDVLRTNPHDCCFDLRSNLIWNMTKILIGAHKKTIDLAQSILADGVRVGQSIELLQIFDQLLTIIYLLCCARRSLRLIVFSTSLLNVANLLLRLRRS